MCVFMCPGWNPANCHAELNEIDWRTIRLPCRVRVTGIVLAIDSVSISGRRIVLPNNTKTHGGVVDAPAGRLYAQQLHCITVSFRDRTRRKRMGAWRPPAQETEPPTSRRRALACQMRSAAYRNTVGALTVVWSLSQREMYRKAREHVLILALGCANAT